MAPFYNDKTSKKIPSFLNYPITVVIHYSHGKQEPYKHKCCQLRKTIELFKKRT